MGGRHIIVSSNSRVDISKKYQDVHPFSIAMLVYGRDYGRVYNRHFWTKKIIFANEWDRCICDGLFDSICQKWPILLGRP
jgi:hypothetical protein